MVNILDASVVGLNWGRGDACADLNNDGSVNILDASIIGLNWGRKAAAIIELPPDPATVAPPVDTTVATSIATSTSFLYTGSDPIQTGVAPGTIEAKRAAVLRGRVLTRDGTNLSGVNITILSHPEFGSTMTRADGMFDMAVNGGGLLTVNYEKTGYLTAQRQVNAPWQDYVWLPDIVMIQADPVVTNIELSSSAPIQVAQGSIVNDSDGTRQATLLFPQGIQANMTLPDGTTQPLTNMHIRATEYTVGENGPEAMPGELPPNIGYTYAVELSVDEAPFKVNGKDVIFNQPVVFYVENFLNFTVGIPVPLGYYDRDRGAWVPSNSGIIIKILNITDGMADLDINGSGQAANASALAALNVTDAERQKLATLYQPGQSIWRMTLNHLSTWDANWGTRCKDNKCDFPRQPDPEDPKTPNPCQQSGSIIGCETQTLGESLGITGTPFNLHYQSDRVPGRKEAYTLEIQLSGASVPENLKGIILKVFVAGRNFIYGFPAAPNQIKTFTWDGKDAYGRILQGNQPVTIRIGYIYEMEYVKTDRFGYNGGGLISVSGDKARQDFILWQAWKGTRVSWDARGQGLGSWNLDVHHAYDTSGGVLYLGDGRKRSAQSINKVVKTVAGTGSAGFSGDNGSATQAQLYSPQGVAIGADGSLYIADSSSHRIRRVDQEGNITTVAGTGINGFSGDDNKSIQARLYYPEGVAIGADGSLYIADSSNNRVRRVRPDGIITTVAGNGIRGFSGDGGPAKQAQLYSPKVVAIGVDGSLYIGEPTNRVRRVGPDGIITTVAGTGSAGFSGDGGPATQAQLSQIEGVAIGADGSLYIADLSNYRVRRVGPDGIITTVAGNGKYIFSGDGGPATQAQLTPLGVAIGADGSLYITDSYNNRVRRVGPDAIITTVAGNGIGGFGGDGGPATQAQLSSPFGVAMGADGSLYIADYNNYRVRRVAPAFPGISLTDLLIPSEDGSELYIFNSAGRHLRTLDAFTNAALYNFIYNSAGRLYAVTDRDGNMVTIERDAAGNATAIVSPYGQRTNLTLDANGYLDSITNPKGESVQLAYTSDGLLTKMTDPRNNIYRFSYDSLGRLIKDEDPAGGFKALERTDMAKGYSVKLSTGLNHITTYQVEQLSTGDQRRLNTFPDGLKTETIIGTNGSRSENYADGTRTTLVQGPDPRFGMLAPVTKSMTVTTLSGLKRSITNERTATLNNPNDPMSLKTLTETTSINGRTFTSTFDAVSRNITSQTPMGRNTITTMDNKGRMVERQVPGIVLSQFAYDIRGRPNNATQGTRNYAYSYDAQGNLINVTTPLSQTVGFGYDSAGRKIRRILQEGSQIQYGYDTNGNLISITPPGRPIHAFNYTPVDLIEKYIPPDVGIGDTSTSYTYSIDRQLTNVTRPDGAMINYSYDSVGRLSTITYPHGIINVTYDSATGNVRTITAPDEGMVTYGYDGKLLTDIMWSGSVSGSVRKTFDNNFIITSESVNGGNTVNFQYDLDSLLTRAGLLNMSHDPQNGLLTGSALGNITDTLGYNSFGEAETYLAAYNGINIFSVNYTRDDLKRIIQKNETIDGTTHTYSYSYDLTGRLSTVSVDGILVSQYVYDANGNRLSYTNSSDTVSGIYDNQDRLLQYGTTTYNYTANGELLSKINGSQTTTYQYDVLGNLINLTIPDARKISYLIDGQNRRIGKKINDRQIQGLIYKDQLNPIAELDGTNTVISRFIYASHSNVPDYMIRDGNTYRIITDNLGSPRLIIDTSTGLMAQRMDYDEFGNVVNDTNPGFQPFGFAGGLYDNDTGLVRFGMRDYDGTVGRWTMKDPILFSGGDTNLYNYVQNDPINSIDPSGLYSKCLKCYERVLTDYAICVGQGVAGVGVACILSGGTLSPAVAMGGLIYVSFCIAKEVVGMNRCDTDYCDLGL